MLKKLKKKLSATITFLGENPDIVVTTAVLIVGWTALGLAIRQQQIIVAQRGLIETQRGVIGILSDQLKKPGITLSKTADTALTMGKAVLFKVKEGDLLTSTVLDHVQYEKVLDILQP